MISFWLFFVTLSFTYVALSEPVPKDGVEYFFDNGTKRYYLFINPSNFFQAFQFCRTQDMQLLTINSAGEQTVVESIIKAANTTTRVWTSGTRLSGDRQFFWLSTGRVVSYSNWIPTQPDNHNGIEHCLEIWPYYRYEWNDNDCNLKKSFICEEVSHGICDSRLQEIQH